MLKHNRSRIIAVFLVLCMLFSTSVSFAAAGDGNGTGNGENRDVALTLTDTSVADNTAGVAVNETIQLTFNKNICNVTVLPTNKMCFHLTESDGTPVAVKLIFPDNQVQREYRHEVFIQPVSDLKPETQYRVSIDNTLMAKNGTVIDDAHTITFTTGTHRTDAQNEILAELGDYIITYESASGENENSVPVNKGGLDDVSEDDGSDAGSIAKIAVIVLVAVIIIFSVVIVITKRRKE